MFSLIFSNPVKPFNSVIIHQIRFFSRDPFPNKVQHYLYRANLIDSIRLSLRSTTTSDPTLPSLLDHRLLDSFVVKNALRSSPSVASAWSTLSLLRRCSGEEKKGCTESYNIVMQVYMTLGKDSEAVQTFNQIINQGGIPNSRTFTIMIEHLLKLGNLDAAMKVFETLPLMRFKFQNKQDNQHGTVTRGICLSEEQTVNNVLKRPNMGLNNELVGMVTESQRVIGGCEVTAILIIYGLPRNLKLEFEEGICQVLGHMWLESQTYSTSAAASSASSSSSSTPSPAASATKKGAQSDYEKKLVEFCKNQIETDDSPVYDVGFKKVNQMVSDSSLHKILKSIQHSKKPDSNL